MPTLENIQWAWRVLWARAYVIADEYRAVCSIPVRDPHSFDNILMLSAQYSSLTEMRNRINDLLAEHENSSKQLYGKDIKKVK